MAASFKNSPLKVFIASGIVLTAFTLVIGLVTGIYFSTKKTGKNLNEVSFGESISLNKFADQQKISSPWIRNGDFLIETEMQTLSGSYQIVDDVVTLNKDNKSIRFNGVGNGKLTFYYSIDKTINYSLYFSSNFRNKQLTSLLMEQYPGYFDDGCLDREEINKIKDITLRNVNEFLGSDFSYFLNLQSLTLESESVIKITHFTVAENTKIFVPKYLYLDYLSSEYYTNFKDNIFPVKQSNETNVVVLHKEGGTLYNSWDKDFDSVEIEKGTYFFDLPDANSISKRGSTFQGWFDKNNNEFTDDTIVNKDIKIYAKWSVDEYPVNYYVENAQGDYDKVHTSLYHLDDDLDIFDIKTLHDNEYRKFIGWATSSEATTVEYDPLYHVDGYFDGVNSGFDLYAVFAHKNIDIKILNKTTPVLETSCSYGASFLLKNNSEPTGEGKFIGYSLNKEAISKDYDDNIMLYYGYDKDNSKALYVSTKEEAQLTFYCVFNQVESFVIYYNVTNANEASAIYYQTHCIDGDESSGNLIQDRPLTFRSPDSFYKDSIDNIDKVGKHFVGWYREYSGKKYLYTNYSFVSGFTGTLVKLENFYLGSGFAETANVEVRPYYAYNTIYVTYEKGNASTVFANKTIQYGNALIHSGSYTKPGSHFDVMGVYSNSQYLQSVNNVSSLSADVVKGLYTKAMEKNNITRHENADGLTLLFKAQWIEDVYTITFNSNGGSQVNPQTRKYGEKVTKPANPTYEGYTFQYWYKDNEAAQYNFDLYVTGSFTLKAKWEKNSTGCLIENTLITMADGSKELIQNIQVGDLVQTWNFFEGEMTIEPVIAIMDGYSNDEETIHLVFDNGKEETIYESHAFFNYTRLEFVNISMESYRDYLGDEFYFEDGPAKLIQSEVIHYTGNYYFIITAHDMNCFANGAMNIVYDVNFMFGIASINEKIMFNNEEFAENIVQFGYTNYEDYQEIFDEVIFEVFNGKYLNILIGKGLIDLETILDYLTYIS